MQLADLDPRWLILGGKRVGFVFKSPTHLNKNRYQTCFFQKCTRRSQYDTFQDLIDAAYGMECVVQYCSSNTAWKCEPHQDIVTWDNISITPSLDGSRGGNWHGYITNGQIVGGL